MFKMPEMEVGPSIQEEAKTKTKTSKKKKKTNNSVLPKFLKLSKDPAPSPDPVHGIASRNYNKGNIYNGELLLGTSYRVGVVIGAGRFGQVFLARNVKTNEQVAVKIERQVKYQQLKVEWRMYSVLNKTNAVGIPKAYHFGPCGKRKALVLELLGPSLEQVFALFGHKFSEHTVLLMAVQLITRLEHLHFHNIINREIKPANLLISKPPKRDKTIFIVDFGGAKYYRDPNTKRHVDFKVHKSETAHSMFMSVNAHGCIEQTRRDDLEALGYVLIYFLRGSLPWQGLSSKRMMEMKKNMRMEDLVEEHRPEYVEYMKHVRKLDFEDTPNYSHLRRLFMQRLRTQGYDPDGPLDWSDQVSDPKRMAQLQRDNRL